MIFVSVGTHEDPFDRLLEAIAMLGADEEIIAQCGPSRVRPLNAACHDYMAFDEIVGHLRRARAVVTHAGVGSIMVALSNERHPIVMARRASLGEHVDDHQVELAGRMAAIGLVTEVDDVAGLEAALSRPPGDAPGPAAGRHGLAEEIGTYIGSVVQRRSPAAPGLRGSRPCG